ncbi:MAG: endonuclease [bacterium]|nr:endonuclease [bacterium]
MGKRFHKDKEGVVKEQNRYNQIIERIFFDHYVEGAEEVLFERTDIERVAQSLGINLPKNLGDVIYSFRYRTLLPQTIGSKAPEGKTWIIRPAGRALYKFVAVIDRPLVPQELLAQTKIPDATPGIVAKYSLNDEQALLAKVRYNRLIDIFTGVTCYSLQNHLRTTVSGLGQVETDEIYVGIDRRGAQYVFPVQAKGGVDRLSIVQIEQDFAVCAQKFPNLICRAIAAQFMEDEVIALFRFEMGEEGVRLIDEKHYRLVPPDAITPVDLNTYSQRGRID